MLAVFRKDFPCQILEATSVERHLGEGRATGKIPTRGTGTSSPHKVVLQPSLQLAKLLFTPTVCALFNLPPMIQTRLGWDLDLGVREETHKHTEEGLQ